MTGPIWLNLPSTNLARAREFYTFIGFTLNGENPNMVSLAVGTNKVILNIFDAEVLKKAMGNQTLTDTTKSNETMFSLGLATKEEVDQMTKKVADAGGTVFAQPGLTDGWYGSGFTDPDGHRWNYLYMDMSRM